nr:protein mono-ADP-ribosyltransferase PARP8-like [Oncorhynchus nerka]
MGMCSRQERIQKDVNIVIQRCKAEKDCLFSDFRYSDATFTFTYSKGSRRVSYSVHVSDDYPGKRLRLHCLDTSSLCVSAWLSSIILP